MCQVRNAYVGREHGTFGARRTFSYAARRAGALSNMGRSRRERALETEYTKIPPPVENTGDGTSGQLLGAAVIKVVCRQLSADRCRIGIEQHGEETAELCLHLIACKVENVAVRQRFLCDSGRGNNAAFGMISAASSAVFI